MNSLIKQIADESGVYIAYENRAVTDKELESFAEQIVKHCVSLMTTTDYSEVADNGNWSDVLDAAAKDINLQFGMDS